MFESGWTARAVIVVEVIVVCPSVDCTCSRTSTNSSGSNSRLSVRGPHLFAHGTVVLAQSPLLLAGTTMRGRRLRRRRRRWWWLQRRRPASTATRPPFRLSVRPPTRIPYPRRHRFWWQVGPCAKTPAAAAAAAAVATGGRGNALALPPTRPPAHPPTRAVTAVGGKQDHARPVFVLG
jgi:hypothetical protein